MGKIAAVLLFPYVLLAGAAGAFVLSGSVLLVDVNASDGPHIVAPVPLSLAKAALAIAPDEARSIEVPELAGALPHAERILEELRKAPDGVFVEVEGPGEQVAVSKEGDILRVRVTSGRDTNVELDLPLGSVAGMLEAYDADGRSFRTSELLSALGDAPRGPLVNVLDGSDEVRVRMLW